MDIARITSFGLSRPLPLGTSWGRPGAAVPPSGAASGATVDLTTGHGLSSLADRADPAVLAWERSLVDLRRQGTNRRADADPADSFAEPVLRRAAETLGLRGRLSQDEVDRRFREIVKAERPDLGAMTGERLDEVRGARSTLKAHLERARWFAVDTAPPPGAVTDLRA